MDVAIDAALHELAAQVRAMTDTANRARGKEGERLQAELSALIAERVPALMAQGLSVAKIQDVLRAAVDDVVPQTYAPDAAPEAEEEDTVEILDPPASEITFFLPMEEADISAFAAGEIEAEELMEIIREQPDMTPITMPEGLDVVLAGFGEAAAMERITGGGEIVAGADGEALMPEVLEISEADVDSFLVCEPMVFKPAAEIAATAALLAPIDEKAFRKKASIKKLLKSGWLDGYEKRSVKKEADYIIGELWEECALLREVYLAAARSHSGMVIFAGYQGGS